MAAPFASVWEGFIIMILSIIIGVVMSFAGGLILDAQITAYEEQGVWDDVGDDWDPRPGVNFLTNIYMLLMYSIPVMGILSFFVTVFWRQKYDKFLYQQYEL